ncbi:MAG: Crp/Fnr family transcriptional regulator [Paracoccaceae bacterium]
MGLAENQSRTKRQDGGLLLTRGWLSRRDVETQQLILGAMTAKAFEPGETLYRIGDSSSGVYGLAEGWVSVSIGADDGRETMVHASGPGFWIGDLSLLSDRARQVTLVALGPVRALALSSTTVTELVRDRPQLYRDFYDLTRDNMETALRILGIDRVPHSDRRLALRLMQLAEPDPSSTPWLPLTQPLLAELVSVSVPTLQRAVARLVEAGLIEPGYGGLQILDRERLSKWGQC